MLLCWVLTRDKASVLAMADDYGAVWIEVEGKHVERVRPQGRDDVARAYRIDESIPAEERMRAAVLKSTEDVIPAEKEIRDFLRRGYIQCQARRNGSGDIENVGREQWGGLRFYSFEGRDVAVPVNAEVDRLQCRSLADYLSGSVPANPETVRRALAIARHVGGTAEVQEDGLLTHLLFSPPAVQ